jgi:hypothetical protein
MPTRGARVNAASATADVDKDDDAENMINIVCTF